MKPSALQPSVGLVEALERERLGNAHRQLARRGATDEIGRPGRIGLHLHRPGINPTPRVGHRGRDRRDESAVIADACQGVAAKSDRAPEQQAHGHTADIDRPITYEQMADDTAALLQHLGIAEADVFGYSMGGGIALLLAIRHPEVVRRLVVASAGYTSNSMHAVALEMFNLLGGGVMGDLVSAGRSPRYSSLHAPGFGLLDRADWLLELIPPFLDAGISATG